MFFQTEDFRPTTVADIHSHYYRYRFAKDSIGSN